MLSKKVDATLGAFWNYEGIRPAPPRPQADDHADGEARRADLQRAGHRRPPQGLDEDGASKLRRFLRAPRRGHELLRSNPEVGVDALLKADPGSSAASSPTCVSDAAGLLPDRQGKPFGWQDPTEWKAYGDWMYPQKLLKPPPDAGGALTNEFLPGEGLSPRAPA